VPNIVQIVFSESTLSIINNAWSVPAGIIVLYVYGRLHFNTRAYQIELTVSNESSLTETARLITQAPPVYTTSRKRYNTSVLCYIGLLQLAFLVCVFWYSIVRDISRAEDFAIPVPALLHANNAGADSALPLGQKGRANLLPAKILRNPLKRLDSDERIQGNPSFSNP
jgi:hypothetical protein